MLHTEATLKQKDTFFRVAFQNLNGITQHREHIATEEVDATEKLGIDLAGMIECKISWNVDQKLSLGTTIKLKFGEG